MLKFLKPRNEKELLRCVNDALFRIERYALELEKKLSEKDAEIESLKAEVRTLSDSVSAGSES